MTTQLRSTGLLLMPEHNSTGCPWCQAIARRNRLIRDRRFVVALLLSLLALLGWEWITR